MAKQNLKKQLKRETDPEKRARLEERMNTQKAPSLLASKQVRSR